MTDDVEALRAQLTAAEARATAAEAEAARAQAEAARAALAAAEKATTPQPPAPQATAPEEAASPSSAELSPLAQTIAAGYAFETPGVVIGTLMDGDSPAPGRIVSMPLGVFNRHLLVAGATGTGKTRTLQLLAEGLSAAGAPVLLCDVKGDLTGLAEPGPASDTLSARTRANGQAWFPGSFPVDLLALGGVDTQFPGATVRTTVTDFGPILLARALDLNTTQEQSLQLVFSWADAQGLELIDLADLRSVIAFLTSTDGKDQLDGIGGVSKATAGVILRALTALEAQGGDQFFGEPGFDTADLMRRASDGRGVISLLGVGDMSRHPALVSAVIMWLLADLFSGLPEVGDPDRPTLVFVFDEAHLLFADATKEFLRQVVQTVRLIRSKGVGIVFVTQTPKDIPADVLAQLGSRVQHALRAATPDDQKRLRQTVSTFPNTELDLEEVLTTLGTGEAVVTVLAPDGRPTPVAPTRIWAPASVMGPAAAEVVSGLVAASPLVAKYATAVNPISAEEKLAQRAQDAEAGRARAAEEEAARVAEEKRRAAEAAAAAKAEKQLQAQLEREAQAAERAAQKEHERAIRDAQRRAEREQAAAEKERRQRADTLEKALGNAVRAAGTQLGREITRSIFGTRRR